MGHPRVLGVLAGTDMPASQIAAWARSADLVLAADGGANPLRAEGVEPSLVIGDMDSVELVGSNSIVVPSQDRSDVDKVLEVALGQGHASITLCNIEGDFPDHVLATLHSAIRSPLEVRLAFRRGLGRVIQGPFELQAELPVGTRLSLLPIDGTPVATLRGVEWPLDGAAMSPSGLTSLSNRTVAEEVAVAVDCGSALLVLLHPSLEQPHWEL